MKLTAILAAAALVLALTGCAASGQASGGANNAPDRVQENPVTNVSPDTEKKPAQQDTTQQTLLTREEAIAAALKDAGVAQADVRDLNAELDRERSTTVWEVDFEVGNTDYSYDIDAATGKILHQQIERD